MLQRKRSAN